MGSSDEQRTYIGEYSDDETSYSYLNARYYNPGTGMFLSEDPVFLGMGVEKEMLKRLLFDPQQQNSYSYARGNPIGNLDPTGETVKVYIEEGNASKDGLEAIAGHAFVSINGTIYSWGPGQTSGSDLAIMSESSFFSQTGKNSDSFTAYTFDTTSEQEQLMIDYYSDLASSQHVNIETAKNPREFNLFSYNCTDVVVEALKNGGILSDSFTLYSFFTGYIDTPAKLKNRMDKKFDSQQDKGWVHGLINPINSKENSEISNIASVEKLNTGK